MTPELTVVCFLWQGWRRGTYGPEHVERLQEMCKEHLTIPHDFVCVTNQTVSCKSVPLPVIPWMKHNVGIPSGYYKLWSFSSEACALGKKLLVIDLDTIITANIDGLLTDDKFKVLKGFSNPYGSAIFQIEPGAFPHVWNQLDERTARMANKQTHTNGIRFNGSDQAVMAYLLPNQPTWSKDDGIYHVSYLKGPVPEDCRILIFAGPCKPWDGKWADLYWGKNAKS